MGLRQPGELLVADGTGPDRFREQALHASHRDTGTPGDLGARQGLLDVLFHHGENPFEGRVSENSGPRARHRLRFIAAPPGRQHQVRGSLRGGSRIAILRDPRQHHVERGAELFPGLDVRGDEAVDAWIRRAVETCYHPVGTCKMGMASDHAAVVDEELRVHGVGALRVVDASIMPSIVSGNTNAHDRGTRGGPHPRPRAAAAPRGAGLDPPALGDGATMTSWNGERE